jgi:glycosyltransferase involved in cell wall biosynthesis
MNPIRCPRMARVALVHNHVGGAAGGGGGVRQMLELGLTLEELGHQVTIACHDFEPGTEHDHGSRRLEVKAVRSGAVRVPGSRLGELRHLMLAMRKVAALVPDDAEVVNAHETFGLRAGRIAANRLDVPLVWTRNDETLFERAIVPDETIFGSRRPAARLARGVLGLPYLRDARRAGVIVVLDRRNAAMVERSYRRTATIVRSGPSAVFFDPPDRAAARRMLGVSEDAFLAAGVGILFPHRRFEDLVEAIALLAGDQDIRTLVIGSDHADPAYANRIERLIADSGVSESVSLRRRAISDSELRHVYAAADVFVFPNRRQTWGLAPLEALAGGTPAIVSSGAGVHEVLEGRPGVVVVPPERPRAIADALLRIRAGDAGDVEETRAWIRTELTNRRYAERMLELYVALGK